jgi:hypothetical protein
VDEIVSSVVELIIFLLVGSIECIGGLGLVSPIDLTVYISCMVIIGYILYIGIIIGYVLYIGIIGHMLCMGIIGYMLYIGIIAYIILFIVSISIPCI